MCDCSPAMRGQSTEQMMTDYFRDGAINYETGRKITKPPRGTKKKEKMPKFEIPAEGMFTVETPSIFPVRAREEVNFKNLTFDQLGDVFLRLGAVFQMMDDCDMDLYGEEQDTACQGSCMRIYKLKPNDDLYIAIAIFIPKGFKKIRLETSERALTDEVYNDNHIAIDLEIKLTKKEDRQKLPAIISLLKKISKKYHPENEDKISFVRRLPVLLEYKNAKVIKRGK
jgi:hypothetical protein